MKATYPFQLIRIVIFLSVFAGGIDKLSADITGYDIFKTTVYQQTDDTQPVAVNAPDAYFFGAQFFATIPNDITNVSFSTPNNVVFSHDETNVFFVSYGSSYFATKEDMDAAFPDGDYFFEINQGEDSGIATFPTNEFYATDVPYFTGTGWDDLQALDPNGPFTLTWNDFTPNEAAEGFVFLRIFDERQNSFAYSSDALLNTTTHMDFSAGTLRYGTPYHVDLIFSTRSTTQNAGFSGQAESTAGFDVLTSVSFTTPAPILTITPGDASVVLSWPLAANDYSLECTHDLTSSNWSVVTCPLATVGDQLVLTNQISATNTFFRLHRY